MTTLPQQTALLIIDVQEGIDHPRNGVRNNPEAEAHMSRLLAAWRRTGRPIVHIQHISPDPQSPLRPGQPGVHIKDIVRPQGDETLIQKRVNSAFIGTDLEERLRTQCIDTVVIIGLTTEHCVSATTRMAGDLGFRPYVISDATAAFGRAGHNGVQYQAEEVHGVSLATLDGEFATVLDSDSLLRLVMDDENTDIGHPDEPVAG